MKNTEIERKYLVKYMPERFYAYEHKELEQAYLSFGGESETEKRIRLMRSRSTVHYLYTEKSDGTLAREENEFEISKKEFDKLTKEAVSKFVKKSRYYIPVSNDTLLAELDVFHGELSGLVTVEVEFKTLADSEAFLPPEWFGEEITEDTRYKNKNLAKNGKPSN
jgi:CYTH domain-containing protein